MTTYRYTAQTAQGEETAGTVEAAGADEAVRLLTDRELHKIEVYPLELGKASQPPAPVSLTSRQAEELSQHVAQVSTARVPMAAGLRAAAEEAAHARVATALTWIADQIEQGRTLEETLTQPGTPLPPHVSGLILAAAETGSLGEALFEIVELQQKTYSLRREIVSGYIYPLVVVAFTVLIIVGPVYYLTGAMRTMFDEFELELPLMTRVLFWWRDTGIWLVGEFVLCLVTLAVFYRLFGGPIRWRRMMSTLPLFGALWHWTGVAEWAGLLSVLLRHRVPLPEALRWAGRGTRDAYLGHLSLRMADGVARGRKLSQMMYAAHQMPVSIIPMVEWGEQSGAIDDSFRVGQKLFEKRARTRAMMLQSVVPPLLFIWIGSVILFVVVTLFLPLVELVAQLSG